MKDATERQSDLSILIVNWNSRRFVEHCIASIEASAPGLRYEIIVIDSGSFDGCEEMLLSTYPRVRFVQCPTNVGFGRANNLAAAYARGAVLLFLNPDTQVTTGALDGMYRHIAALRNVGALGCRLLNADGSLQTSCVQAFPTILNQLLNAEIVRNWVPRASLFGAEALFERKAVVDEVEAVSGACLMIRREVFAQVGGFSPEYFMYGEDIDLCFKTHRMGYRNYHAGDAVVVHHGGGSTQQAVSRFSTVMMVESVFRLLQKSRGSVYGLCYRVATIVAATGRLVILLPFAPVALCLGRGERWYATAIKWLFILRWGLGMERWTAGYNGSPLVGSGMCEAGRSCAGSAES